MSRILNWEISGIGFRVGLARIEFFTFDGRDTTRKISSGDASNLSEASLTVHISGDAFLASAEKDNRDASTFFFE